MSMFSTLNCSCAALLALTLLGTPTSRGDEPPKKDEALNRLFEKLDEPSQTTPKDNPDAPKDTPKSEPVKESKGATDTAQSKAGGEVAPKDQALDNLLEKLGETKDRPDAQDERRGGRPMPGEDKNKDKKAGDEPMPPKTDPPAPDELTGKDKSIDERLEELTGRNRKKKAQDEEGSGPLGQVIKEMREVEQRLGKPDTGDETRKKQTEIVKNLDQIIEQLRKSSSQMKTQKRSKLVMQPGQKPGSQPGQTEGANAAGAPNTKPAKPESKHAFANGKDEWGHLPPELRQEIDNIAREVMLPSKEELIRLYYLSVSKKSQSREE